MVKCWICCDIIKESLLLPGENEYFGQNISIFKDTFIIKEIKPFKFYYYTCCEKCINNYLKIINCSYNYIKLREIGKKLR